MLYLAFSMLFSLDPCSSMLVYMLFAFPTWFMLYAMFSHAFFLFLFYVDVRVTCSHAWCHVFGYALFRSACLHACFYAYMSRSMFSNACMLGFVFFPTFMLTSTCLDVHSHAYISSFMLIFVDRCVHMLRSLFSTCFMPSSMCLCASRHVYMLRPRLCLSCHVLL